MVVIAALVGADGLGKPVVRALNTVNIAMGFEAGLAIVLLAIILDRVCSGPTRRARRLTDARRSSSRTSTSSSATRPQGGARAARSGRDPRRDPRRDRLRPGRRRRQPRRRARRDLRADGPVRLRQVDAAARRQRAQHGRARHGARRARGRADRRRALRRRARSASCARTRVAMVFQQFALLPWRTVRENVGFGLELRGIADGRARHASSTRSSSWSA